MASVVLSMSSACTCGSSASGANVATKRSSSTSCVRAQPPTIEIGTRIVAITMHSAESHARHTPPRGAAAPGTASTRAFNRAFSASRAVSRAAMSSAASEAGVVGASIVIPHFTVQRRPYASPPPDETRLRSRAAPPRPCRARRRRRRGSARTRELRGSSQVWPSRWRKVLTVASSSSIAATMSPFSAVVLRADDDPVAVADRRVDHRLADDLEHEQVALADELAGEREDLLDLLLGRDRHAGGDAADERHHRGVADDGRGVGRVLGRRCRAGR